MRATVKDNKERNPANVTDLPHQWRLSKVHEYWTFLLREKKKFDPWLENRDDITAANALIVLIQRATGLLGRQLKRLERDFIAQGGFKEKMFQARAQARATPDSPPCPVCNSAMKKRSSSRGDFWGCSGYPACKGTRPIELTRPSPN